MTIDEILTEVLALLQREGRVSYRMLKRRFGLDDDYLEDLKAEIIDAKHLAVDEDGKVLVWAQEQGARSKEQGAEPEEEDKSKTQRSRVAPSSLLPASRAEGERRQLTVMFCDLVGSTALSAQLDPEEYREVVRGYQETCATVIERFGGHIAQYLGDGLLVYFGYPIAHEDDAARAVRSGLEIVSALQHVSSRHQVPSPRQGEGQGEVRLQVRLGIHTGLVVIGEIGSSEKREMLALGETPNIAARIQGQASPNEVLISAATYHLVEGLFECEERGQPELKGITTPLMLYLVRNESTAHSRFETALQKGLTPLVGRDEELALLRRRWEQAKDGEGQVVLLNGEAGIGKSRLVQEMKERVSAEGATRIEFHCSPYHQNSALYPIIDHLQRLLQFQSKDTTDEKLHKLEQRLAQFSMNLQEAMPLFAALLSLPAPRSLLPALSPQKQKEKTQEALVAWLIEEAARQAVYLVWEDLHWIDPSSLEVLTLVLQQMPTRRMLVVILTYRPDFTPPWRARAYSTQLTLSRLGQQHVTAMVNEVMALTMRPSILRQAQDSGRTELNLDEECVPVRAEPVEVQTALSAEVIRQIVSRTDGVPLFVEEITKTVVESVSQGVWESSGALAQSALQFSIPTTLQDALMARLDRLGTAKIIAQLGATLGREFSYELLQAVAPVDATALQQSLQQLVDAELLYQRGLLPQSTYVFKHALIQDTAYQSLLKSTRQQYHTQIAQVLAERFSETVETHPELLAHHYTEAGFIEQALPYWRQAGERDIQHSAHVEAIAHFTKGLELLKTLPDTSERAQQELTLQLALGVPLYAVKGYVAPEVEKTGIRARELCQQLGESPEIFPALSRLWVFYHNRGELQTAHELAEQRMRLAQSVQDRYFLASAHTALGMTLTYLGEFTSARTHLEKAIVVYDPQQRPRHAVSTSDPRVLHLSSASRPLWCLGYPDQGLKKSQESLALAAGLSHPFSLAFASGHVAACHLLRQEGQLAREGAEAVMTLAIEQGFPHWLANETLMRGEALILKGQGEEGLTQLRQGLAACRAMGVELGRPFSLAWLAEACGKVGQIEEGLSVLAEALAVVDKTGERYYEAELYRLKGELSLQSKQVKTGQDKSEDTAPRPLAPDPQGEAEACFLKAIEIAQKQQAKSLELRASTSLAHLWQQQGKGTQAHKLLSEVYNWFTEGFDTKDLQEAKTLIEELA